ncbi:hypothetical protein [Legionella shakespearei]|uniref:Uncharacterized protein n=1 Tax=Legionella shakespearei DSM 23087 TaxID=1122169 RepID=A0A0W0YM03_9GAMM|nr:hypothetical protein [Legionella shakespearei]KTD57863.1 hypothetical protein Lsha_2141 [Legionella shakespearei DSM 23087]
MTKPNFFATTATPVLYKAIGPNNQTHYFLATNNHLELGQVRKVCDSIQNIGLMNEISMIFVQAGTYHKKKDFPFEVTARTEHDNQDLDNIEHHGEEAPHAQHFACHRVKNTINAKESVTQTLVSMADQREMPVFTMQTKNSITVHELTAFFKIATKPHNIVKFLAAGPANIGRIVMSFKNDKKDRESLANDYMEGRFEYAEELMARHPIATEELAIKSVDEWCKRGYQGPQDTPMTKTPLLGDKGLLKKSYFQAVDKDSGLINGGALFVVPQGPLMHKEYGLLTRLKAEGWTIEPVRTKEDIACRVPRAKQAEIQPVAEETAQPAPASM